MEDQCIEWTGAKWAKGRYGKTTLNGKSIGSHRAAWIKANGEIPKGMLVCHSCDNGLCINVSHLFLGTQFDNMRDCSKKGRTKTSNQTGSSNNNFKGDKLKTRDIAIKIDRQNGLTLSQIGIKYGLKSNGHISKILSTGE